MLLTIPTEPLNPFATPSVVTLSGNATLSANSAHLVRVTSSSASYILTIPSGKSVQVQNAGATYAFELRTTGNSDQQIQPGTEVLVSWDYAAGVHRIFLDSATVDLAMSGTSYKPVANATIKQYVDDSVAAAGISSAVEVFSVKAAAYGAVGDGVTDDTAEINAAATAAGAAANSPYDRPTLYFPPGDYLVTTGVSIPIGVDVLMHGATISTSTVDLTQPVVTIGSSSGNNSRGKFLNLSIRHKSATSHGYDATGDPNFAGFRFVNCQYSELDLARIDGFYIGAQLYAAGSSSRACQYNRINVGQITGFKIGIDVRAGDTSGAWANENSIYGGNYAPGTAMKNYGTCWAWRTSRAAGGYSSQNHNKVYSPCGQMGNASSTWVLIWSAGAGVTAGWRCYWAGKEYLATGSGTTGATPPTHLSGTVSDGGVSWTYLGSFRRGGFLHQDAGERCLVRGARWETGIGSFARFEGTGWNGRNSYELDYFVNDMGDAVSHIEDRETATNAQIPCTNEIRDFSANPSPSLESSQWHMKAIKSANGWTIAGVPWIAQTFQAFAESYNHTSAKLCLKGLNLPSSTYAPCMILDVRYYKRWRVHRHTFDDFGRLNLVPLDADLARVDLGTSASPTLPMQLVATSATISSTYDFTISGSDDNGSITFVAGPLVAYVAIFPTSATIEGLRAQVVRDVCLSVGAPTLFNPYGDPNQTGRRSDGTPTVGFFRQKGEFIGNIGATTGQPPGWIVTTAGVLAPAWATGVATLAGELRTNGGRAYAAVTAGTSGSTAPAHSSGTVSDGTIDWAYVDVTAVLTALPNL